MKTKVDFFTEAFQIKAQQSISSFEGKKYHEAPEVREDFSFG